MDDFVNRPAQQYSSDRQPGEVDLSLSDIVAFLWGYRFLIGACVTVGAVLSFLYVLTATPIYTAKAQVLIESRLPQNFREQVSESIATLDTPAVESQIAIIMSEKIAEKVVKNAGFLDAQPEPPGGVSLNPLSWLRTLLSAFRSAESNDAAAQKSRLRDAMEYLWTGMGVGRLGLSHVIEISYSAPDRDQAARVANAIADSYIEDQLETRAEAARQGSIWLEKRIDSLRQQMNEAALRVKEFKARRDYRFPSSTSAEPAGEAANGAAAAGADEPPVTYSLEDLESQATTYRKIYESYLQAYTETVQTQSYPVTNTRVITRATRPNARSSPRGMKVLAIAVALGIMAGVGLALIHHSFMRARGRVEES
ncbi:MULTISPECIES: GumC family protein [Rhodomicrobium]|uniref:GumC family protein n=1 Tax=Rhodomicrobium TaxID=1068 RepID=UPI0014830550|nr:MULTISPECIES: GumC family protein [Rhodomicrobium]